MREVHVGRGDGRWWISWIVDVEREGNGRREAEGRTVDLDRLDVWTQDSLSCST